MLNLNKRKKKKYKIRFVIEEKGMYNVIGKKKLNPLKQWVRYKNNAYLIDVNNPTYSQGLNLFYLIDVKGKSIKLTKQKRKKRKIEIEKKNVISEALTTEIVNYDPEAVDLVIFKKIVKQLSSNLNANAFVINLIAVIIGAAIAGPIGWILAGMV